MFIKNLGPQEGKRAFPTPLYVMTVPEAVFQILDALMLHGSTCPPRIYVAGADASEPESMSETIR